VLATVETAWLFIRGPESVRIVRAASPSGTMHLLVQGPGEITARHEFVDVMTCMAFQADLERRLVNAGYTLESFNGDRRTHPRGRPPGTGERRRLPQLFL